MELRPLKNEIFFIIPRFKANSSYCNKASNGTSDARVITLLRELIRQLAARIQLPVVASPS